MRERNGKPCAVAWVIGIMLVTGVAGCHNAEKQAEQDQSLLEASKSGNVGAIDRAVQSGAQINARSQSQESGRTPLMLACLRGQASAVQSLLAKGADVNARDTGGMTALMWASFGGRRDIVQLLLDKGADANAKDRDGQTAANWGDKYPAIAAMLKRGKGSEGSQGSEVGR